MTSRGKGSDRKCCGNKRTVHSCLRTKPERTLNSPPLLQTHTNTMAASSDDLVWGKNPSALILDLPSSSCSSPLPAPLPPSSSSFVIGGNPSYDSQVWGGPVLVGPRKELWRLAVLMQEHRRGLCPQRAQRSLECHQLYSYSPASLPHSNIVCFPHVFPSVSRFVFGLLQRQRDNLHPMSTSLFAMPTIGSWEGFLVLMDIHGKFISPFAFASIDTWRMCSSIHLSVSPHRGQGRPPLAHYSRNWHIRTSLSHTHRVKLTVKLTLLPYSFCSQFL